MDTRKGKGATAPPSPVLSHGVKMKLHELKEKITINAHCLICGTGFQYPYGRWSEGGALQSGTCSKKCEQQMEARHAALLQSQARRAEDDLSPVLRSGIPMEVQPTTSTVHQ